MQKSWLAFKKAVSTKQLLYILLFIDSLAVTVAISKALILQQSPYKYFTEKKFITDLSCWQLAIAGILSLVIYTTVKSSANSELAKSALLWLIIGFGLIFLALDDSLEIHEQIDLYLHDFFAIKETRITDLADDLIVGFYLLIFLGCIFWQRKTIALFKSSHKWFLIGIGLAVIMVFLDLTSNNNLFTSRLVDPSQDELFRDWMGVIEDSAKIFAEGMFLVGIYQCLRIVDSKKDNTTNQ